MSVLCDTSFLWAARNLRDSHHARAVELLRELLRGEHGKPHLTDLIFILNRIMRGGPAPTFECQADLNADKIVTLLDVVVAVNYLFKGGNPPLKSWACCL